ncbi:hypothetical protein HMPREF3145_03175 [Corynebacterium sp. HMSC05C01]|nr:hypothetical protein HMPREF3145_03175 [Corynebacterium sp. HMSC05C01]
MIEIYKESSTQNQVELGGIGLLNCNHLAIVKPRVRRIQVCMVVCYGIARVPPLRLKALDMVAEGSDIQRKIEQFRFGKLRSFRAFLRITSSYGLENACVITCLGE